MARVAKNPAVRKASLIVSNEYGLHLRAAAMLVKMVEAIDAQLTIECGQNRVNGKSLMSLVTLGASKGMVVTAFAEGAEADQMVRAVTELFNIRFYEIAEAENQAGGSSRSGQDHASALEHIVIQKILERVAASPKPPAPAATR